MKLLCTQCEQPVARHCPDTNPVCGWVVCRNHRCTAHIYDLHRGLLRHTDGTVETWDDQPTSTQPPTVTVEDETDRCRHCGRQPEADGDHTCPCPHPDDTCPHHGRPATPDA